MVEVKEASILAMLDSRSCIPGASMTYIPKKCRKSDCEKVKYCLPMGLNEGDRFRVEEVLEKANSKCQNGEQLALCKLRRISST